MQDGLNCIFYRLHRTICDYLFVSFFVATKPESEYSNFWSTLYWECNCQTESRHVCLAVTALSHHSVCNAWKVVLSDGTSGQVDLLVLALVGDLSICVSSVVWLLCNSTSLSNNCSETNRVELYTSRACDSLLQLVCGDSSFARLNNC